MAKIEDQYVLTSKADTAGIDKGRKSIVSLGGAIKAVGSGLGAFGLAIEGLKQAAEIGGKIVEVMKNASPEFAKQIENIRARFEPILNLFIGRIADALMPVLDSVVKILADPQIKQFIYNIGTLLVMAIDQVVKFINDVFIPALNVLLPIFNDVLKGNWEGAWNKMLDFVRAIDWGAVLNGVLSAIAGVWSVLTTILETPFNQAKNTAIMMVLIIEKVFNDLINGMIGSINRFIDGLNMVIEAARPFMPGGGLLTGRISHLAPVQGRQVSPGTNGGFAYGMGGTGESTPQSAAKIAGLTVNIYPGTGSSWQQGNESAQAFLNALRAQGVMP